MNENDTPYVVEMGRMLAQKRQNDGLRGLKLFAQSKCDDVVLDDYARDFRGLELSRQFDPPLSSVDF